MRELGINDAELGRELSPLACLLSDLRGDEEDQETMTSDGSGTGFGVFQTNHQFVSAHNAGDEPFEERERMHMVARLIRWYRYRWGVENDYKKIKAFMVRTTSMCPRYRFFNFLELLDVPIERYVGLLASDALIQRRLGMIPPDTASVHCTFSPTHVEGAFGREPITRVLVEEPIQPSQIGEYKIKRYRAILADWIDTTERDLTLDEL